MKIILVAHDLISCEVMKELAKEVSNFNVQAEYFLSSGNWAIGRKHPNIMNEAFAYKGRLAVFSGLSLNYRANISPFFESKAIARADYHNVPFGFLVHHWPMAYSSDQWFLRYLAKSNALVLPRMTDNELESIKRTCRYARLSVGNHPIYRIAEFLKFAFFGLTS